MPTAQDIIDASLRSLGIIASGDSPSATETADALEALNWLIQNWSAEGQMLYYRVEESFTLTPGTQSYTIGSGGVFNTARPTDIRQAYLQDSSNNSYPMQIISLGEYVRIGDKTLSRRPERMWYEPESPLGKITFDSNPDTADTLYLFSVKPLSTFAAASTSSTLPDEYTRALRYNLAVELAPEFGRQIDPVIAARADESLAKIRARNHASRIGRLEMDDALLVRRSYDIRTS